MDSGNGEEEGYIGCGYGKMKADMASSWKEREREIERDLIYERKIKMGK